MNKRTLQIPIITILFCYLALTQVYRFVHVHAVETADGFQIEWSLHNVLHPHDHDFGEDDHQQEVDHLIGDWDHLHSIQMDPPSFQADKWSISLTPDQFPQTLYVEPRTGPPPLAPILSPSTYRGPPLS
ncbi:hypothetical protein [Rhodohalobacter sp. SW132]|uniref:hypothetical protein n=1 Tax=Rhodohalobacter sp. SW132 TaxID=2293433 RepID=UPI0011C020DD|nr:hypothetical protein [Rhodohalobacter sp. SW132]